MDSFRGETPCRNSRYGCTFAATSTADVVKHFQWDCAFHPVRCFKCNRTVRKVNFEKHYMGYCKDKTTPPCPPPEEVQGVEEAEAIRMMSQEQHFLRECVKECTLSVESLINIMKDVAHAVAEVKEKQQELEATVKAQGDAKEELSKTITEKMNKVEEDPGSLLREVGSLTRRLANWTTIHWYLQNLSKYVERTKTGKSVAVSDMFVLNGYSARLLLGLEDVDSNQSIGLYLSLCRGPRDSLLQWPFKIPYTLCLVHPKDASKSKKWKISPPSTGAEYFKKREDDGVRGFGASPFCTIKTAQDEGFIEDDAVCFSVTLHE